MLPQDDLLLAELLAGLSPAARRQRFHGLLKPSFVDVRAMCAADHRRDLALVVTTECGGLEHLIADARFRVAQDGQEADVALLVHEHWQREGIGTWLLQRLELAAWRAGLRWLSGSVLSDNQAMLALLLRCGYVLQPDPDDEGMVRAQRRVGARPLWPVPAAGAWPGWLGLLVRRRRDESSCGLTGGWA